MEALFGKPDRIDPSAFEYDWWIYSKSKHDYLQVGISNGKAVTVYTIGSRAKIAPFQIGQPLGDIFKIAPIESSVSFELDSNSYRFELTEEDLNIRPLLKIGNVFIQLYFDRFTSNLSSVRLMDAETLVKMRPYELVYRGDLFNPDDPPLNAWNKIEEGNEKQIFELTNIIRARHKLKPLNWDEKTAEVAYNHSKDMFTGNYFSHVSPTEGELADRLTKGSVSFQLAGENIAAQYVDGIAAVEGWLNSEGHRKTLLSDQFTHLGVGVYEKYYTQNFIQAPK